MDLRSWLESKAGLSGRALQMAIDACESNVIDTVADLRIAQEDSSEYEKLFAQVGLRTRITKALDENDDMIARGVSKDQTSFAPSEQNTWKNRVASELGKVDDVTTPREDEFIATRHGHELPQGKR